MPSNKCKHSRGRCDHKQVRVQVGNETVEVDANIRNLIVEMNAIPGIVTLNSCEGDSDSEHHLSAYVQFSGEDSLLLVMDLTMGIILERYRRKSGEDGIALDITHRAGMCLRWTPSEYVRVLRMIRRIAAEKIAEYGRAA